MKIGNFEAYGSLTSSVGRYLVKEREDLFDLLPPGFQPKNVIEFGCADGTNLCYFGSKYKLKKQNLCGVDIVKSSALRVNEITFVHTTAENFINQKISSVDLIILSDVLEHLYNPWEFLKALKPWLNSSGYLLISVPNLRNLHYIQAVISGGFFYNNSGLFDETHIRFFSEKTLSSYLLDLGYFIAKTSYRMDSSLISVYEKIKNTQGKSEFFTIEFGGALIRLPKSDLPAYFGQQLLIAVRLEK
jgi:2-polyprenyl-3-methyl-5-hydroxy-6-metoxy-1,4-benzoquinol methylase